MGGEHQPLPKSMSLERGSCSSVRRRIIMREGRIAACPTKMASRRLRPESIFVRPAIASGRIERTWSRSASFVILRTSQLLHCERTVASTSLGRWEIRSKPTPYFLPSFAIRRIPGHPVALPASLVPCPRFFVLGHPFPRFVPKFMRHSDPSSSLVHFSTALRLF